MAKRTRGSNRPGQRHADRHSSARPVSRPVSSPVNALSDEEEARAAELESEIVAQERVSDAGRDRARERARSAEVARTGKPVAQGGLAVKAAEEYAYVVRDVRRIIGVGGAMVIAMAVLYVLIDVTHAITIS
jgi:hypothetical protein